ncbi:MAG TPA: AMP-binding protein, partial [Thermoanaerobaculia bacterium]|nr:AMP-binding protein [Thermoanaerobaculia bacterium]
MTPVIKAATRQGVRSAPPQTLIEVLRGRAQRQPEKTAYTFLDEHGEEEARLSYAELDERARAIASLLQAQGLQGERALLLYPPGLEFIAAFMGCMYAGVVAVPAYPPRTPQAVPRLLAIAGDARPAALLTSSSLWPKLSSLAEKSLPGIRSLATDGALFDGDAGSWSQPEAHGQSLAFLQYTSGSTSAPKGVMVRHGNLLHNEETIRQAFQQTEDSVVVGWLPLYHDMGLIGTVLQPLYVGASAILMSPLTFLQRPALWLQTITRYHATTSG